MIEKYIIILFVTSVVFFSCAEDSKFVKNKVSQNKDGRKIYRALYIPYKERNNVKLMNNILKKGKHNGINMFVVDVHSSSMKMKVKKSTIVYLKKEKIFLAARIICFSGGLTKLPVSVKKLKRLKKIIRDSAEIGFDEIQLDYIRFQDGGLSYSLKRKYKFIRKFLKEIKDITNIYNVLLSADIFGRIVYNYNDNIGQKLELFAKYTDVIYPMLYPSHFTGNIYRMSHPGETIKEGTLKGIIRLKKIKNRSVAIQPWIQSFKYNYKKAKVSFSKYIELQIRAAESTGARGWVAWNAFGNYKELFKALENIKIKNNIVKEN